MVLNVEVFLEMKIAGLGDKRALFHHGGAVGNVVNSVTAFGLLI